MESGSSKLSPNVNEGSHEAMESVPVVYASEGVEKCEVESLRRDVETEQLFQ